MTPTEFTPLTAVVGGGLIGLAAVLLMASHGRIAGISGIAVGMFPPWRDGRAAGRIVFILGLVAAPMLYVLLTGRRPAMTVTDNTVLLVGAGALVGFGW